MLKNAQLYSNELKTLFFKTVHDDRFKFLRTNSYVDEYKPYDSTWMHHEFVSIHDDVIIGYIKYAIARDTYNVSSLMIVNFTLTPSIIFSRDLHTVLVNIFEKHNFNKISFSCTIGNPIEKSYDKIIEKYGGRIVGVHKKHFKLSDGLLYDSKDYEILFEDYVYFKNKR